jgi:hypothetical protein
LTFASVFASAGGMKTGRKRRHHVNSADGEPVVGLSKMADGRWRIIGTQTRFSEPDEHKAIERFFAIAQPSLTDEQNRAKEIIRRFEEARQEFGPFSNLNHSFWKKLGEQIRIRPQWIAEATSVEKIAYLNELKPPEVVPSFERIESEWKTHFKKSEEQRRRVLHAWADFKVTTSVTEVAQIDNRVIDRNAPKYDWLR